MNEAVARETASFIRTDEALDVLASLETCAYSLASTKESDSAWKWAVLSMHSALQGAMVCHLSGSDNIGALQEKSFKARICWHEKRRRNSNSKAPENKIANACELLKRLSGRSPRFEEAGEIIEITETQRKSFKRLHDLRNEFTHFPPQGWSIEIVLVRESLSFALEILELIAKDPWPFRDMKTANYSTLKTEMRKIGELLG